MVLRRPACFRALQETKRRRPRERFCITLARRSLHALCYHLGALQLGPSHMTSLGVATEMSARSSASRTTGAGGWAARRTVTGITECDMPITARPTAPESGQRRAEMKNKALPFVCSRGRRQHSHCESFFYSQTTRQLISGISPGYCFTRASKD